MDSGLIPGVEAPDAAIIDVKEAPVAILDADGLQPFECYLRGLLEAGGGRKSMRARLAIDHKASCSIQAMRTWIAAEQAKPRQGHIAKYLFKRPAAANAVTTISRADGLAPYADFLSARRAAGAAERAMVSALLQEHQVQCSRNMIVT